MRTLCLDASIGAKWFLDDEEGSAKALRLLEGILSGDLSIVVPSLFKYEVGSAVLVAARQERVAVSAAIRAAEYLEALQLETVEADGLVASSVAIAQRYRISFYDAIYLATAESRSVPLVTDDQRILAVSPRGPIEIIPLSAVWRTE